MSHKLTYGRAMPLCSIAERIGDKAQYNTQMYGARPYGVGLLVAGVDDDGPHLFEFQPSGLIEEMTAFAIGARSQMARTYLERNLDQFADCSRDELIKHGLRALRESLAQDKQLTVENTSVGIVGIRDNGKGKRVNVEPFAVYDDQAVLPWIEKVEAGAVEAKRQQATVQDEPTTSEESSGGPASAQAATGETVADERMDVD